MNSSEFSVFMVQIIEDNGIHFVHPTDNATMYIKKDGVTIKLTPKEIKDVVKSAGGNFRR